jgi:hypothetical protein
LQDFKAGREINNNVSVKDYNVMKNMFENSDCLIYKQYFDIRFDDVNITPTFNME